MLTVVGNRRVGMKRPNYPLHSCRSFFFAVSIWQLISGGGISPCEQRSLSIPYPSPTVVTVLLFLRVWAIWGRTRTVQLVVGGLCALNFIAILISASFSMWSLLRESSCHLCRTSCVTVPSSAHLYYEPTLNRCFCAQRSVAHSVNASALLIILQAAVHLDDMDRSCPCSHLWRLPSH